jgi:hypothetical protein
VKKTTALIAALAALATAAAPASAAKEVKYKGKTASGHPITFTLKNKRLYDMNSGIAIYCLPIQGGGKPETGVETFNYSGWAPLGGPSDFTFMKKPAYYWNEVTTKHTLTTKLNRRTKAITGTQRIQYSYMVSKYPVGTFVIYSCLGNGKFKAKPVG